MCLCGAASQGFLLNGVMIDGLRDDAFSNVVWLHAPCSNVTATNIVDASALNVSRI